jgi:hypothetical protein
LHRTANQSGPPQTEAASGASKCVTIRLRL